MSRPLPPTITVGTAGWQRTFTAGHDVVIGRDVRADLRLPHAQISRAHAFLRFVDGRWVVVDNKSMNGMFVGAQRMPSVDIRNTTTIHFGTPDGSWLTFQPGPAPQPVEQPTTQLKVSRNAEQTTVVTKGPSTGVRARWRGAPPEAPPGSTKIGRDVDDDVVIPDVMVSRHHATLVPTPQGVRIEDAHSATGTFVNGQRIKEAVLQQDDVVSIGNVDFVYAGGNLVPRTGPATTTGGLEVRDVSYTIDGNRTLLERVSLSAKPATLTAVIGPSGSGKSTLLKAISGALRPSGGTVSFEAHDVHGEFALMRSRIGLVPQDDVVHRNLTVNQELGYAAELRMPPDASEEDRQRVVAQVLEELEMTPHADTRLDKLSGGQRKRVSVALELLTGPSLLLLDEPTTGLDPALDQQVMRMLRQLADAGRVVVVVTHSLAYLDACDQVLLLAPGGKPAYLGPPGELATAMGSSDWADVFTNISVDPDGAHRRFLESAAPLPQLPPAPAPGAPVGAVKLANTSVWHQFWTLSRRQVRLVVANRGYFVFLALLPFLVGVLPLAVTGETGFGKAAIDGISPYEPRQILGLMNFAAFFMGTALTVRELVGERDILHREQAVGLSTSAYLASKIAVFSAIAVIQAAILVAIVTLGKGAPESATLLGSPTFELFVGVAATCVGSAMVGLFVSSLARTSNQVLPLTIAALMVQLVLGGGMVPVTDRPLDPLSWLTPARWGYSATASTSDLTNTVVLVAKDSHWVHSASTWTFNIFMIFVLSVCYAGFVRWKIRPRAGVT